MGRHRHAPAEIVEKLRRAEVLLAAGDTASAVATSLGVSSATFHRWRAHYGGIKADDARRLAELELENRDLKNVLANQCLDILMLRQLAQQPTTTPQQRSVAVRSLRDGFGISERRACTVVGQPRSSERRMALSVAERTDLAEPFVGVPVTAARTEATPVPQQRLA